MTGQDVQLLAAPSTGDQMSAHERLLGDAMKDDATLFAREDTVEAEWRIVASILDSTIPPHEYRAGTWRPAEAEADRLMDRPGGRHKPLPAPRRGLP